MMLPNIAPPIQRGEPELKAPNAEDGQHAVAPSWYRQWDCGPRTACAYGDSWGVHAHFGCVTQGHCHSHW